MNKKLLRSEMILHDDTNSTLANALGISPQSLSSKMNETNGAEFTQKEISKIRARYAFPNSQGLLLSGIFEFQSLAVKGSNGEVTGLRSLL